MTCRRCSWPVVGGRTLCLECAREDAARLLGEVVSPLFTLRPAEVRQISLDQAHMAQVVASRGGR